MDKEVANWLDCARYDLETAKAMFAARRYIYSVFMSHLTVENALKAKAQEITGQMPPKTHDLIRLLRMTGLSADEERLEFLEELNTLAVVTRYPCRSSQNDERNASKKGWASC